MGGVAATSLVIFLLYTTEQYYTRVVASSIILTVAQLYMVAMWLHTHGIGFNAKQQRQTLRSVDARTLFFFTDEQELYLMPLAHAAVFWCIRIEFSAAGSLYRPAY